MTHEIEPTLSLATYEQLCRELGARYGAFVLVVEKPSKIKAHDTCEMMRSYGGGWSSCWALAKYANMRFEFEAAQRVAQAAAGLIPG